jgi:hypothetical protein
LPEVPFYFYVDPGAGFEIAVGWCREMRQPQFETIKSKTIEGTILFDTLVARQPRDPHLNFVDTELYELVAPEQKRQHQLMAEAMKRVCELVWP